MLTSETKNCEQCGNTYSRSKYYSPNCRAWKNRKFCSRNCKADAQIKPMYERLWSNVNKEGSIPIHRPELGPCWEWTASTVLGYGHLVLKRRRENIHTNLKAHRLAYEFSAGPIPDGLYVCHKCDNPLCVRPEHLFLGTQADNMKDRVAKFRDPRMISLETRQAIRAACIADGRWGRYSRVARTFNVSDGTVKRWEQYAS